jgi:hypothetical protein
MTLIVNIIAMSDGWCKRTAIKRKTNIYGKQCSFVIAAFQWPASEPCFKQTTACQTLIPTKRPEKKGTAEIHAQLHPCMKGSTINLKIKKKFYLFCMCVYVSAHQSRMFENTMLKTIYGQYRMMEKVAYWGPSFIITNYYIIIIIIIIIILLQLGVHPVPVDHTLIQTRKDYT